MSKNVVKIGSIPKKRSDRKMSVKQVSDGIEILLLLSLIFIVAYLLF